MEKPKIKLVVINEHTLAYISPETPYSASILHDSILKGSNYSNLMGSIAISRHIQKIRLATEKDFEDFRVCFKAYKNDPNYEYQA